MHRQVHVSCALTQEHSSASCRVSQGETIRKVTAARAIRRDRSTLRISPRPRTGKLDKAGGRSEGDTNRFANTNVHQIAGHFLHLRMTKPELSSGSCEIFKKERFYGRLTT